MAGRKRPINDFDPNKSDSEDEDYDNSAPVARQHRPVKKQKVHRSAKPKKRRRDPGDGSDDMSDDDLDEESFEDSEPEEEEQVELNPHGRPIRGAAKKPIKYEEPSDSAADEDDESAEEEEEEEEEVVQDSNAEEIQTPKKKKRMLVKLKVHTPVPPGRTLRARSVGSGQRPQSASGSAPGTRRSSRLTQDAEDTIVELSNSGHHVEVVRQGTRSPDTLPRSRVGGKGLKYPSKSTIDEGEEESSKTKDDGDHEIEASQDVVQESEVDEEMEETHPDDEVQNAEEVQSHASHNKRMSGVAIVQNSDEGEQAQDGDDDEDYPTQRRRPQRTSGQKKNEDAPPAEEVDRSTRPGRSLQSKKTRSGRSSQRRDNEESSDFEPPADDVADEDISSSEESRSSPRKGSQRVEADDSSDARRSRRMLTSKAQELADEAHDSELADELADELQELRPGTRRRAPRPEIVYEDRTRRKRKSVDYRIIRPDLLVPIEDPEPEASTPSKRGRGGTSSGWQRTLLSTYGPFGGASGPAPVLGGPGATVGGVDSDSSDDDTMQRPRGVSGIGGAVGMTPTSAFPPNFGLFNPGQTHGSDPVQGPTGTPANLGKVKDKQALADADPLGIDQNVNFDSVGGMQGHIDQLKEMVSLPLLYPEVFQRFHIVPPRGVLFHGPPGTGKTLLARALASSVSSQGRKVTFYMRKGADALSKWVGEAERQLRLLFEEARKTQPSIIFFDEIDGLAPVRSSKQEQIHASIVSTLLALMDGMDGRGQVIVIGATNRPDSIDPALRRPGRFDREFYFPLPDTDARRSILDIHTKGWDPPLPPSFKDELAELTKGYGGADIRALCTEAALNAVQRRYPQIYKSNEKLLIDPKTINVNAKDFMISIKKIVPSSERSTSSGASALPRSVEPLLRVPFGEIKNSLGQILPHKKKLTALEEAQYEDAEDAGGFKRERMQQEFERSRVFRPRLLIRGPPGMGQQYLAAAVLNHFDGLHVQAFDLPTLFGDSASSPEATVVHMFQEVKRHRPSVIYLPNLQTWYDAASPAVITTFMGLLRSLPPTDPILLLGILESEPEEGNETMLRDLFGYSKKNRYDLVPPGSSQRHEFFNTVIEYLKCKPSEFPDPANRRKRKLEILKPAPPPPPKEPEPLTKEEEKALKKKDRQTLNMLKIRIQPIMDQMKKSKKFRTGVIDESQIRYLYAEEDPATVTSDLPIDHRQRAEFRPFEKAKDAHGEAGLLEVASGKFFYNIELVTIEKRLSNGYYKRPKDFLADVKRLTKDARQLDDQDRLLKANELQANVEVDIGTIEMTEPALVAECENVYIRELKREKDAVEKARRAAEAEGVMAPPLLSNVAHAPSGPSTTDQSSGPVVLGEPIPNGRPAILMNPNHPVTPSRPSQISSLTNGYSADMNDLNDPRLHSNGSSHPSNADVDVQMGNTDETPSIQHDTQSSSFGQSAQPRPPHSYTAPSLHLRQQSGMTTFSQKSTVTPMAPGSQVQDYVNDASTTTSGKKTSDPSSGPQQFNTQSSNGASRGPDLSLYPTRTEEEVLPDTQNESDTSTQVVAEVRPDNATDFAFSQGSGGQNNSSQSQPRSNPGSQPPVPMFDAPSRHEKHGSIHAILNNDEEPGPSTTLIIDHPSISILHDSLAHRTSGFSVEQLEQVNTALMDCIWASRDDWNRTRVAQAVRQTLDEVLEDMVGVGQEFGPSSMEIVAPGGQFV